MKIVHHCAVCKKKIGIFNSYFAFDELNHLIKKETFSPGEFICYKCGKLAIKNNKL